MMKGFIRYILKENLPKKGILIKEGVEISKGLKYHKEYDLPLVENVFLPFSDEFFSLINETRGLWKNGLVQLCEDDEWLLKTDIGKTAMFEGDEVWLDIPFLIEEDDESINEAEYKGKKVNLNSPFKISGKLKKFAVYVKEPSGDIKMVKFGDPNNKPETKKNFRVRHKCDTKNDKTKAAYWACNISKYRKKLGIKS
jgi:hypothetical protein